MVYICVPYTYELHREALSQKQKEKKNSTKLVTLDSIALEITRIHSLPAVGKAMKKGSISQADQPHCWVLSYLSLYPLGSHPRKLRKKKKLHCESGTYDRDLVASNPVKTFLKPFLYKNRNSWLSLRLPTTEMQLKRKKH